MNFVPESGCDVALETLKTAGLPIRDKSLPQVQAQRPQSSQTQPRSQDRPDYMKDGQVQRLQSSQSQPQYQKRPGSSNTGHSARPQSLDGAFQGSSQTLLQEPTGGWNSSIPPSSQPTGVNIRPLSAPGGLDQDEFSRPISALSRPTLDVSGSTTAVSAMAVVAKPRTKSGLLPSPVFNGTYEPFGSFQVRPVSAPEQIQTQRNYSNTLPLSQMLPPERTLPFPEKKIHPFRRDEATSQEEPSQEKPATTKTNASKQTKPRAQPAKPRKSRAKIGAETISSDPLAPSSPLNYQPPKTLATAKVPSSSAPPRVSTPESQAIPSSSDPLALSIPKSRKRALTEQSVNQPNKRQAQTVSDTATKTIRETLTAAVPEHGPREQRPQDIDPLITTTVDTSDQDLLGRVDDLVRSFRDVPAPTSEPRTAKDYLAKYAAHCDEDRAKAIDNYMCECIKNDDFWKLMDDVEGSWKRLGFGL